MDFFTDDMSVHILPSIYYITQQKWIQQRLYVKLYSPLPNNLKE